MGRPSKQTVEYFPHYVHHGRTIYIIQSLYGNDGYAFFYKLLEVLGDAEGHYYDCRDETSKEFLAVKTHVGWITGAEIINKLCSMGIIDSELWGLGIIWMDSFVESIKDAYRKRTVSAPQKPHTSRFLPPEIHKDGNTKEVSSAGNPQSKLDENRANENKEEDIGNKPLKFVPPTLEEVIIYCRERNKGIDAQRWYDYYTANGWMVGKNKMKDWKAAIRTWESNTKSFKKPNNGGLQYENRTAEYPTDLEETM